MRILKCCDHSVGVVNGSNLELRIELEHSHGKFRLAVVAGAISNRVGDTAGPAESACSFYYDNMALVLAVGMGPVDAELRTQYRGGPGQP